MSTLVPRSGGGRNATNDGSPPASPVEQCSRCSQSTAPTSPHQKLSQAPIPDLFPIILNYARSTFLDFPCGRFFSLLQRQAQWRAWSSPRGRDLQLTPDLCRRDNPNHRTRRRGDDTCTRGAMSALAHFTWVVDAATGGVMITPFLKAWQAGSMGCKYSYSCQRLCGWTGGRNRWRRHIKSFASSPH
jgi:hypothetical protein